MPKDGQLEVGKDISKKEYKRQLEILTAADEVFAETMSADKFIGFKDYKIDSAIYEKHSKADLEKMVLSSKNKAIMEKARKLEKLINTYNGKYLTGRRAENKGAGDVSLDRSSFLIGDASYLLQDNLSEDQIREAEEANLAKMNILADANNIEARKAFYEDITKEIEKIDVSKLNSTDPEVMMDFFLENYRGLLATFLYRKDICIQAGNQKLLTDEMQKLADTKVMELQTLGGGFQDYIPMLASDYSPVFQGHEIGGSVLLMNIVKYPTKEKGIKTDIVKDIQKKQVHLNSLQLFFQDVNKIVAQNQALEKEKVQEQKAPEKAEPEIDKAELEKAEKWFESLKEELKNQPGDMKLDPSDPNYMLRFYTFKVSDGEAYNDIMMEDQFFVDEEKDLFGNDLGFMKHEDYLDKRKSFDQFTPEYKLNLYQAARRGELIISTDDGNLLKEKAIYVKDNGSAGVSKKYTSAFSLETNLLKFELNDNPDFCKDIFPGAANANELATHIGKYLSAAIQRKRPESDLGVDVEKQEKVFKRYDNFVFLQDMKYNPEFYNQTREIALERMAALEKYDLGMTARTFGWSKVDHPDNVPDPDEIIKFYDENKTLTESFTFKRLINSAASSVSGRNDYSLDDIFKKGIAKLDVDYKEYTKDVTNPDQLAQKLVGDLKNGKIHISVPFVDDVTNMKFPGKITFDEGAIELKGTEKVSEKDADTLKGILETIKKDLVDITGTSKRDSMEFTKFSRTLNNTLEHLKVDDVRKVDLCRYMKPLVDAAHNYFLAKIDQPMNARRTARFIAAHSVEVLADKIYGGKDLKMTVNEVMEDAIASKITFETIRQSLKSKDIKKDPSISDTKAFQRTVDAVKRMNGFKAFTEKLDSKKMAQICSKDMKDLHKSMLKAEIAANKERSNSQKARNKVNQMGPADKKLQNNKAVSAAGPGLR